MSENAFSRAYRISRNLGESRLTLMKRLALTSIGWIKAWYVGLRSAFTLSLGNRVLYRGESWVVSNHALSSSVTLTRASDGKRREYVPRSEFRVLHTPSEVWHRVSFMRGWWDGYWLDIWVGDRLGGKK